MKLGEFDSIPLTSVKASASILSREQGNISSCNDEQIVYLQPVITQHFASNKSEIWS